MALESKRGPGHTIGHCERFGCLEVSFKLALVGCLAIRLTRPWGQQASEQEVYLMVDLVVGYGRHVALGWTPTDDYQLFDSLS